MILQALSFWTCNCTFKFRQVTNAHLKQNDTSCQVVNSFRPKWESILAKISITYLHVTFENILKSFLFCSVCKSTRIFFWLNIYESVNWYLPLSMIDTCFIVSLFHCLTVPLVSLFKTFTWYTRLNNFEITWCLN